MKYKLLRLSLLSMLFMFFGGLAFAQDEPAITLDFTSQDNWDIPTSGTNTTLAEFTDGTYTIKLCASTNYKLNSGYLLLGKSGSFIELPEVDFDVAKIEVVGTSSASAAVVQYISNGNGNALVGVPETTGAKNVTNVYEFTGENQKARVYRINVNSNHNTQISKVFIYKADGAEAAKTVTFVNDANWNKVYVWAWNDTENFTGGEWPGVEISPDNDGKYTWSTTGDPTKIIFSDGSNNQTADLPFEDGAIYKSQGKVFTATFSTNAEWNNVYAYAWTGDGNSATKFLGEWPGTQLTKDDATDKYTLSFEATEAPEKIIFNDGGNNQTEDLDFVNGKDYVYTVLPTYTSIAAMLADITSTKTNIKYQFENLLVTYVNGSNTFVSDGENGFLLYGSNLGLVVGCTYSGTATGQLYAYNGLPELSVYADNINATLQTEGTETTWKTITPADIQNNINVPVVIENAVYVSASGKNLTFKVGETDLAVYNNWSIDITALEADKAYTLKGIGCIYVKNETTTYQIYLDSFEEYVAPVVDTNYYILGDFWGWDNPQLMTQSAETANVYTLVADVTVEADTYEYKLRQGDNWDGYQLPAQGNQNFVFGTEEYPAGTYTLTFTANLEANTLELAVERDALEQAKAELAAFIAEIEAMYNEHKDEVPADSQAEVEQAIQDAKDALESPNATVESLAQAQADLQAAMLKAQSDALGLNENVTDKFDIEYNWISEMGAVTDYKNENENLKEVRLDTTTDTGKVIHKTVEKLENGTYDVKLIGGALFTGNGETAALQSDEEGRVVIYANNVALSIPVKFAEEGNTQHYELNNVVVSDNKMEIGMEKLAPGSNRHFIQIEKVKMLSNTRQVADEEGQNNHWKGIAQTILGYEAYNTVTGEPREALAAAETKADIMAAIPAFYAAYVPVQSEDVYSVAGEPSELFGAYWNEKATETEMTLNNEGLYEWSKENVTLAGGVSVQFKVVKNHDWSVSYPANNYVSKIQEDGVYNVVITFNDKTEEVNAEIVKVGDAVIENAEITQVELRGDFNNWSATDACTMTKGETENVWTMTLDLTNATEDQKFKLVVNNEKWIGNQEMQIDAPDGWVDSAYDQDNNLKIQHSITGYNTYTVTATWDPNANADQGWTLKFEGKDEKNPVVMQDFSIIFTTNADWQDVYAYAWNEGGEVLGTWPGTKMSYNDRYTQYELSFQAADAPKWIIFNNGTGGDTNTQTENLDFENQKSYTYTVEKPLIAEGTYYIKNVATQKFLAAGSSWGTHAVVNDEGLDIAITLADGKYTLDTQISNGGSNNFLNGSAADGPWTDGGSYGWTVTEVEEGVFTLSNADDKYIAVGDDNKLTFTEETAEAAQWTLVSVADHDAANLATLDAATAENGVDATFFIKGANFNRNDLRNNNWKATKSGGNQTIGGPSADRATYGCESWNNTFEVSQTLENLPEGVYQFSIAGYGTNGTTYIFAGESEAAFVNTESAANFGAALDAIASGSYTGNVTGKVNVMNGTLKVGVKRESQVGQDWAVFDNARLTYFGPIPADEFKNAYEEALAAAQAAIADDAYAVVTGEERTALAKAIEDYSQVEATAEAYKAATIALNNATSAFKDAKGAYDGLIDVKNLVANMYYEYASAEKREAAETAANATAENASDATEKTAAIYKAYRQYAESSAMLEGVDGATDFTDYIVNPKAEQDIAAPWSVVLGEGSGGSLGILSGEPWTDGDDNSTHRYFDGGNWGAQAWDVSMMQEVTLPAGKYQLTVKSRANTDMSSFTVFAGENKTEMQHISASGGLFNRGWNDASVEFELTEPGTVTIGVQGVTDKQYQWMSFSDFRLVSFSKYEPVYSVAGAVDNTEAGSDDAVFGKAWEVSLQENDMTEKGDGIYELYKDKVKLVPGSTIYYKVVADHDWTFNWGFNGENANYVVNLPEGKTLPQGSEIGYFNITFKFNPSVVFENGFNVDCVVEYDEDTTTSIRSINAEAMKGNVYNLNGQKVTKVQKGLYIVNGKKTVKN